MTAIIDTLKDESGNTIYPQTRTNAVLDGNGNNVDEVLENKVDKTDELTKLYGTHDDGTQLLLNYSSNNQNAWTIPQRDGQGNLAMNAMYSNGVKTYTQQFWNFSGQRCVHVGTLKANWSNHTFAGTIYTHGGYADGDARQQITHFNVTVNNNENLRGFAVSMYGEDYSENDNLYFVKTSNSWEWEMYYYMHNWSDAIFQIMLSSDSSDDFYFTFDASHDNFVEIPSNPALTITPRKLTLSNYQAAIDGATGWNSGYVDIPMSNKILRIQYGQENPNDNGNKRINFPQSYDTILFGMGALSGTVDVQTQRAAVTGLSTTYIEFNQTSNNNQYIRWIAIGIKNY